MADRDIAPVPDSPKPEGSGHYRAQDDIELPPVSDANSSSVDEPGWPRDSVDTNSSGNFAKVFGAVALIAALVVGGWWFATRGGSAEKLHPNWQHVEAAADASTSGNQQLVHVDNADVSRAVTAIEVTASDADRATLAEVRAAAARNDLARATAALQEAQQVPSMSNKGDVRLPVLSADSEFTKALQEGGELYRIQLFDACDEDGDIVEVLVNGASFATVPITHEGSVLTIPLARGNNTVTVRGVQDGGGGVTVSFRTSRGEYFARPMGIGEEHQMEVVVQ